MRAMLSTTERLLAEIGAVTERCGYTCEHHAPLTCKRAAGHQQADSGTAVDVHADVVDGRPVLFDGDCDRHDTGRDQP